MREITRVVRRICLLAEIDRETEASRLAAAVLDPLIEKYRTAHGPDSLSDARLREIQSREQERAGDAAALGEMLLPFLAEHLDGRRHAAARAGSVRPAPAGAAEFPRSRPPMTPQIVDLLDGMLAQEDGRPPPRPRRSRAPISSTPGPKPSNPDPNP